MVEVPVWEGLVSFFLFFAVAAVLIGATSYLTTFLGWRQLAERYKTSKKAPRGMFNFTALYLSEFFGYSGVFRIGVEDDGLYMTTWWFWPFYTPIFIPFTDIHSTNARWWLFWRKYEIGNPRFTSIGLGPWVNLRLREKMRLKH